MESSWEILQPKGDIPAACFGHTITSISKNKVILFGGACGDHGKYQMVGETFLFNANKQIWLKLPVIGTAPCPRAAHAATACENLQMVIYGGSVGGNPSNFIELGGELASDELFLFNLKQGDEVKGQWLHIPIEGLTPGQRYGHSITFLKPHIILFGGNNCAGQAMNDVWCLGVNKTPFLWQMIEFKSNIPEPRVYHSIGICKSGSAAGMVVVFGGRSGLTQLPICDIWGLRKHRNGTWDWVKAPEKLKIPTPRFQHTAVFLGSMMCVLGGRSQELSETMPCEGYEIENSEWIKFQPLPIFRHVAWISNNTIFAFGGFTLDSPDTPTNTLYSIDFNNLAKIFPVKKTKRLQKHSNSHRSRLSSGRSKQSLGPETPKHSYSKNSSPARIREFKLSNQCQVAMSYHSEMPELSKLVRTLSITKLQEESKKIRKKNAEITNTPVKTPKIPHIDSLCNMFINNLLKPKDWNYQPTDRRFLFKPEYIIELSKNTTQVLRHQPNVLQLRTPIKIFGDIHGQFQDLMRFFQLWRSPVESALGGDIDSYDYIFLGDYVDRGLFSLETICLLFALKIKYPDQIHLIRGNHEDRWINNAFGFAEECAERLGEDIDDPESVFAVVNQTFEYLPLAAVIEEQILCIHGGIGSTITCIQDIEKIGRPIEVIHEVQTIEHQIVVDLLWSDPTDNDQITGIQANSVRDPNGTGNIVKFGPDKVDEFLKRNKLSMIIRAHECVMDGFERFSNGKLLTVFSATDYCGRHKNAGAALFIQKNCEIIPKLIFPLDISAHLSWIESDNSKSRPPTPPRSKGDMKNY